MEALGMPCAPRILKLGYRVIVAVAACLLLGAGCGDLEALKREALKKLQTRMSGKHQTFTPRDGITVRASSLYQTANPNSEIIRRLPAETLVRLIDRVGDWYRVQVLDGREGYVEQKVVGGEDIIRMTHELRRSIEGMPAQAEGITKTKANFRLAPGRERPVVEVLGPGKKFEMFERVATLRGVPAPQEKRDAAGSGKGDTSSGVATEAPGPSEYAEDGVKKDVWYKIKIEDGRVGYVYTHNLQFTPPEDIARMVPYMRLVAWRAINQIDDPDLGAKSNFVTAYAPVGKDPGCDYTTLYLMNWSTKLKRQVIGWQTRISGMLPITPFQYEGKPGFSVRSLHPTKKDKLVLTNFTLARNGVRKVGEEEIAAKSHER
jgi:hypothetical protein